MSPSAVVAKTVGVAALNRTPLHQVFQASATPKNKPIGVRLSATDYLEGGWNETTELCRLKASAAITRRFRRPIAHSKVPIGEMYQVDLPAP